MTLLTDWSDLVAILEDALLSIPLRIRLGLRQRKRERVRESIRLLCRIRLDSSGENTTSEVTSGLDHVIDRSFVIKHYLPSRYPRRQNNP